MISINTRIRINCKNPNFNDKLGTITSINKNLMLPFGVTIDGEKFETDFRELELIEVF